jgi:O-antigen/teichoic acid export membrane protein
MTFSLRIDSIMIERLLPDGALQAGIYAQAYRILDAVNMFAYLFATLLLPMFAHMIKHKQAVNDLMKLAFSLLAVPSLTLAAIATFYKYDIMNLLYHEHADLSAPIFGILMFSFFCMASGYIFGTLLTANGSLMQLNIMAASAMVLNIVLNFILIPQLKAYGACLSGFATQIITALIQFILAYRIFKLRPDIGLIYRLIVFVIIVFTVSFFSSQSISNWLMGTGIVVLVGILSAFLLQLISVKKLMLIMKER